jgi:DTW domain-containing protein YfiP
MGTRSKRAERCEHCRMHVARCICAFAPRLTLATRVVLVMHRREVAKPTATGPLALMTLANSELRVHGHQDRPVDLRDLVDGAHRLLALYPAEDARPLGAGFRGDDPRPVTLVVPDGSWRQASKAVRRLPGLDRAEAVTLPPGPPSRYRLRREPKEGGLATFEAIARVLGFLESPSVQAELEAFFERMVEATLATRAAS